MQGGDDRVAAATAAQRPEQVGLVIGVDGHSFASRGDDLDRTYAIAGEPVLAAEPAEAAADRVADNADVGRRAGQRGEPVGAGAFAELDRENAGLDPAGFGGGVDLDPSHRLGLDQD